MKTISNFVSLLLLFYSVLYSKDISFAPLPMKTTTQNIKEFLPLIRFVEKDLSVNIKFINKKNYDDILKGFENKTIDIALLGPLPYTILKSKYPYIKPIVSLKQKDGSSNYRCVLSKFEPDTIDISKPLKIALTQPLSTCGYFMSKKLLKNRYNLDISKQYYKYTMSHINAVMGILKGKYNLAGSTESIAQKFKNVGIKIVAKSQLLPGFSIVVNTKTLSKKQIERLRDSFLKIPKANLQKWGGKTQYGLIKADENSYNQLNINYDIPQKGNML